MLMHADGKQVDTLRLFDSLIDTFPDMIHSLDEKGNIVYVNRMATQLLGFTEAELCGMNILQLYPPEIHEAVQKGFREVKQTGEKRVESLLLSKDGTRIPVEIRTVVLRDEQSAFARTFSISRDLRKLKEVQENLIHAGRLAAIGELAAGVVHDLNNPLTAVIFASAMLKKLAEKPDLPPEDLRSQTARYSERISGSASTMEHLTTRLRDFARGVKEQHVPMDLFDPIHDALFILDHRIRTNKVQVRCPIVKSKHWIPGDRNQIEQIFLNLFANACDAMAQTETRELTVEIAPHALADKEYWCCSVRDTGEGIPDQKQEQVFKAFFTTKPRGKGTGLGLSIARSIVKEHNGEIHLSSEPGKGTCFSIVLPVLAAPTSTP
jgi:PAS domain S-box-containing protein